jgi:hypothetical protein
VLKISVGLNVLFIIGMFWLNHSWGDSKKKIKEAEQNLSDYKNNYASVIQKGDSLDSVIKDFGVKESGYKNHIDSLEGVVVYLQQENKNQKLAAASLFQPDELVNEMRTAFPELKTAPIGVARVTHPETGFLIRTFQVPIEFVSVFISDHREVDNFKKQIAALGEMNLTYKIFVELKDSIIVLKEQKAEEYKKGLDYGLKRYEDVMKEYIGTLKEPPKIEWPSVTSIIAAGAAGVAVGALINK